MTYDVTYNSDRILEPNRLILISYLHFFGGGGGVFFTVLCFFTDYFTVITLGVLMFYYNIVTVDLL